MKATILGCGTSGGVPRIGNIWGTVDPKNPKNRRLRPSILVSEGDTQILVDSSPDLRQQGLNAGIERLDAVLYTHDHADHTHGIDELRLLSFLMGHPVEVYAEAPTLGELKRRFDFAFAVESDYYRPYLVGHEVTGPFEVGGVRITPFAQGHGETQTTGYRFGDLAYSTDLRTLPEESFAVLQGVGVWIVDALQLKPHPTHSHLEQTLGWIERVKPRRAVLTHMAYDMDYGALLRTLPSGVEPAHDGMVIEV